MGDVNEAPRCWLLASVWPRMWAILAIHERISEWKISLLLCNSAFQITKYLQQIETKNSCPKQIGRMATY